MPAYFIAVILAFIVWLSFFLFRKSTRKEMLVVGAVLTPFVILDILTTPTYWQPITAFNLPVGIEGFLFTFFITGIAAVIYETIFKKQYRLNKLQPLLSVAFIIPAIVTVFAVYFLKLNIIYLFILGFTFMAFSQVIQRRDLFFNSVFSSVLFALVYIITFSLWLFISPESIAWWNTTELSPLKIGVVPLEEVLFSLSMGLFVGPLYEYLTGSKEVHPRRKRLARAYLKRK